MRMTIQLGSGLVLILLTACAKDLCDREAKAAEECGVEVSDADIDQCKEMIEPCSKKDKKMLDDYMDCLEDEGLLACATDDTTGGTDDFDALMSCAMPLIGLSSECLEGMSTVE